MTKRMFWATMLASTCLLPGSLQADGPLPTDPNVVAGDITISNPTADQLLLAQSSTYGIVDWGSFSIANGFGVQVQNGSGATLNRVTGSDLSQIFGTLDASGSVYLINQNGVVFGASGVVNTGGTFVASTLDIANADFLDGGDNVFRGTSDAYVINLGSISSLGGDVAILARNVVNEGSLTAPNGTVGLAAGREILMRDASVADGMFAVRIGGSDTSVSEAGAIRAAAAELRANGGNVYALAGNTSGTIAATGVARVKGRVFLTAGDSGTVKVAKAVKARSADGSGGAIAVSGGRVEMSGRLDASGTTGGEVRITSPGATLFSGEILAYGNGSADSGGFVEVSGAHLAFGGTIDTGGGTVLIDPDNIEVTNDSLGGSLSDATILTPGSIEALLRTQNVIIQTSDGAAEAGTIVVTDGIAWSSAFSLSFLAHGDIWFNASVQSQNARGGDLNIVAGWDGSTSTTAFDATPFLTADLATTTLFGNLSGVGYTLAGTASSLDQTATGAFYIGFATTDASTTAVGARAGATRLFASGGIIGLGQGFSQLGFNITNFGGAAGPTGDIILRSTGVVNVIGGSGASAAAQIGHIGIDFSASAAQTVSAGGNILVEANDMVELAGGSASGTYAMIGHGSRDFFSAKMASGDRSGAVTINAGREVSIDNGSFGFSAEAWIGHETAFGTISGADLAVTALSFDQDASLSPGPGAMGILDIAMLALNTAGGNVTFVSTDATAGAGLTLTGTTDNGGCECASITTAGDLVIQSAGDLLLDASFAFSNIGGGDVALAAAGNFHNNSGADAFGTMQGRWLIHSTRPDQNTGDIGVLPASFITYQSVYDPADPFGVATAGNGLLYSVNPVISIGDATMTYGGTLVLPSVQMLVGGIAVNAADFGVALGAAFVLNLAVTFSDTGFVNAGVYASGLLASFDPPSVTSIAGLTFDFGQLTVDRAVLTGSVTGTPTKVYDGTAVATLTAANFLLGGFVTGEAATVTQTTGAYATADASATNAVTVALAAGDFAPTATTDLANYVLPTTASGNGAITQAGLLAGTIIGTPTKIYDGNDLATLTAANFLLSGFVAGEGADVTQTSGTYATANASAANTVTVTLASGDFSAIGTTNLANYVLPTTATGTGAIDRALLTASIVGLPVKPFDGTTSASLTSANFSLAGFVMGEGGGVTQTLGSFGSSAAGAGNTVTANLSASDIAANAGTLLANYILPTVASGPGLIGALPPTQPGIVQTRGLTTFDTTPLGEPSGPATGIEVINAETTQRILDEIRAGTAFCKALVRQEYVIDCLSDRLQSVADGLSAVGEYSAVRAALEDAAQQLHALVLANASQDLARQVARVGGRRSSRALTAVSTAAMGSVNAAAAAIIEGAELVLLRSSSGSEQRSVAFSQVAQVVDSTKVLLRSS